MAVESGLAVGNTPLYTSPTLAKQAGIRQVWLKDETVEPTGSFKDRATWLVIAAARAIGRTVLTCASTGNAASSLAGLCAAVGMQCYLFVSARAPRAKLIQPIAYGAHVFPIDGTYDDCVALCMAAEQQFGWYNRTTAYNPWTIEGKKSAAWEIAIQSDFNLPDQVFIPTGDGAILGGTWKGFYDLYQLGWISRIPRLVAVQPEGSCAIIAGLEAGDAEQEICHPDAASCADSLVVRVPRNAAMALTAIRKSNGYGVRVSDAEILSAVKEVSSETGILVEPAAAAAWAGLKKAREEERISSGESAVLLLTGSGLKDISSVEKAIIIPETIPPTLEAVIDRIQNNP
jgi:threonine synthase